MTNVTIGANDTLFQETCIQTETLNNNSAFHALLRLRELCYSGLMKKLLSCFLFVIFTMANLHPQTPPANVIIRNAAGNELFSFLTDTPDPDIKQLPREITSKRSGNTAEFIRLLAQYINEKSNNDYERVKKAHDWVALNIRYDTQSFFSGNYSSQSFDSVIRRGSGVCAGYADVFKYLCDALEIECTTVSGFARGYGSGIFSNENVMDSNHAWNIVTINGNKYLIDTTWNSGYLNGRTFQARYKTEYFLTPPEIFIYDHYSYSSASQLLEPMISAEEFKLLPFIDPAFFNIFETWPDLAKITEALTGQEYIYEFTAKAGYQISYAWYSSLGVKNGVSTYPYARNFSIKMPNLRPGNYYLRIFAKTPSDRLYYSCANFGFTVKNP